MPRGYLEIRKRMFGKVDIHNKSLIYMFTSCSNELAKFTTLFLQIHSLAAITGHPYFGIGPTASPRLLLGL